MNERHKHIIEPFHRLYYDNSDSTWMDTTWLGHIDVEKRPVAQHPAITYIHPEFEIDRNRERFYLTFNPRGYLRRK